MNEVAIAWKALTTTWSIPAAFFGVIWGIIGGALPGISPSIAMALLLPFTYGLEPVTAVVLLASVYVGAEYGGSIPAILIRTPGTNAAAATVIDGFEMHKQGRGGEALGISLVSGLVGGLFGLALLILLTEPLARLALAFTPPAYFAPRRPRPQRHRRPVRPLAAQGSDRRRARIDDRDRRHRSGVRRIALHVRLARSAATAWPPSS